MEGLLKKQRLLQNKVKRLGTVVERDQQSTTAENVNLSIERVNQLLVELNKLYADINNVCDDEQYSEFEDSYAEYENILYNQKAKLLQLVSNIVVGPVTQPKADIKLPKLELPTFTGSFQEWASFRDLFVASVHNNQVLTNAQKLQYLKSSLKGEASLLIQSFQITDVNYNEAWVVLNERYENNRETVNAHLERLLAQPVLQQESANGLRRLIDTTNECLRALKVLNVPIEHWDVIIVHIISKKLDSETRRQWELSQTADALPTLAQFMQFLNQRARAVAAAGTKVKSFIPFKTNATMNKTTTALVAIQAVCEMCKDEHPITRCKEFENLTVNERQEFAKKQLLCFNCLRSGHKLQQCQSGHCRKCGKYHNTLLHYDVKRQTVNKQCEKDTVSTVASHVVEQKQNTNVLLATALIKIRDKNGVYQTFRALLDSASQASIATERCAQQLGLVRQRSNIRISGVSSKGVGMSRGTIEINFKAHDDNSEEFLVKALVLASVTRDLPVIPINHKSWEHIKVLKLADPCFYKPNKIDILLGADVFGELLRSGRKESVNNAPTAIETSLGWILTGKYENNVVPSTINVHHTNCEINDTLQRFWDLEQVPTSRILTPEEAKCEEEFESSYTRETNGRFVVKLPFRSNINQLGESRSIAIKRLNQVERRLEKTTETKEQYNKFISEYINLRHAEIVPEEEVAKPVNECCYLPHHAVIKDSSTTTKLRVVFDASARTASGVSLNDTLMIGPKLQDDIVPLLLKFRTYKIAFSADIEKMYRQIKVQSEHAEFQRIVWRESIEDPIKDYRLLTITYGTASAPYQAVKCLQKLASDVMSSQPRVANIVLHDFYMDDLLSGADSEDDALTIYKELRTVLKNGGFEIRKWSSNSKKLMNSIPGELKETENPLCISVDKSVKTLGVQWCPSQDYFCFVVSVPALRKTNTKRTLLSDIAKLFDPMGWLAPTVIRVKLLFQSLWRSNLQWDDELPEQLNIQWQQYREELSSIENLKLPRCIVTSQVTYCELHGFCDASQLAYAAVVYLRTISASGDIRVNLVIAKTKVAPLKVITLPRLELCGAVLLARLMNVVLNSINLKIDSYYAWSDSTIALAWIKDHPSRWKTFIANRVAEIQSYIPPKHWHHVRTEDNPADCASRGTTVKELLNHGLWWTSAPWLTKKTVDVNDRDIIINEEVQSEQRTKIITLINTIDLNILERFSSFVMLCRVTAWCLRFFSNTKLVKRERNFNPLSVMELNRARYVLIKLAQQVDFGNEIFCLENNQQISQKSKILCLNPFLDKEHVLRVGGRLNQAKITYDQRHPILLAKNSVLTKLIIECEHKRQLHAGPQLLLNHLRQRYWIVGGREIVRKIVNRCIICHRQRTKTMTQLMGNLPEPRVKRARPFQSCGVDYAGPVTLRILKTRVPKTYKAYIALFVCFATKAIHLELVTDQSSEAFLAALKRFVSRRGRPGDIYSDCGTNFIGADKELKKFAKWINSKEQRETIVNYVSEDGIQWHFNPPSAPHFGGLWESGVKSMKFHIRRIMGNVVFNYEEFSTLLCQVEACLNSRPLTAMNEDSDSLEALTPGHFLTGDTIIAIPEPNYIDINTNRLSRWKLIQKLTQHFWQRWQSEYLSRLQQRPKWMIKRRNLMVGELVLVKEDNLPPSKWKLGRITEIHPGKDKLVRAATVKTTDGVFKRPIVKLSPLPFEN